MEAGPASATANITPEPRPEKANVRLVGVAGLVNRYLHGQIQRDDISWQPSGPVADPGSGVVPRTLWPVPELGTGFSILEWPVGRPF